MDPAEDAAARNQLEHRSAFLVCIGAQIYRNRTPVAHSHCESVLCLCLITPWKSPSVGGIQRNTETVAESLLHVLQNSFLVHFFSN